MDKGEFKTIIVHYRADGTVLYGPHEIIATYEIIEGDVNNNPVYKYEILRDGIVYYSGEMRNSSGREQIFKWFTDLCLGVR